MELKVVYYFIIKIRCNMVAFFTNKVIIAMWKRWVSPLVLREAGSWAVVGVAFLLLLFIVT